MMNYSSTQYLCCPKCGVSSRTVVILEHKGIRVCLSCLLSTLDDHCRPRKKSE